MNDQNKSSISLFLVKNALASCDLGETSLCIDEENATGYSGYLEAGGWSGINLGTPENFHCSIESSF